MSHTYEASSAEEKLRAPNFFILIKIRRIKMSNRFYSGGPIGAMSGSRCDFCGYIHPPPVGEACPNKKKNNSTWRERGDEIEQLVEEVSNAVLSSKHYKHLIKEITEAMKRDAAKNGVPRK